MPSPIVFAVVSWPATSKMLPMPSSSLVGQLIGMIADQHAEDVVARVLPVPIHQRLHVGVHLERVLGLLLTRDEDVQHRVTAPLELWLIFEWHAE